MALGQLGDERVVESLVARLDDPDTNVCQAVVEVLVRYNDPHGFQALIKSSTSKKADERRTAVRVFASVRDETIGRLLSRDLDGLDPWLDPADPITLQRVQDAAQSLDIDEDDVTASYEALAAELSLRLEWRTEADEK